MKQSQRSSGNAYVVHANWRAFFGVYQSQQFSYPRGFSGDLDLLDALCGLLNRYFAPNKTVLPEHLATAPGAMAALDTLLYNICDAGDSVLIPGPYWSECDVLGGDSATLTLQQMALTSALVSGLQ